MSNKKRLFGTDGIRGRAESWPLNAKVLPVIAKYACTHLKREGSTEPVIVIGYDTRESCGAIFDSLKQGFEAFPGAKIISIGIVPTPAVAFYVRENQADFGVMISASHNPYHDNGIKFFDQRGEKLEDSIQEKIETEIVTALQKNELIEAKTHKDNHNVSTTRDTKEYEEFLFSTLADKGFSLQGLKVVVDCANGSAYEMAPRLLKSLGADVIAMANDPDGRNINEDCGAVHTKQLQEKVTQAGADIGLAFDGDADRLIVVDGAGAVIDGDHILGSLALKLKQEGKLQNNTLVVTVMTNMGLDSALQEQGISIIRTAVGDRYVMQAIKEEKASIGGEQSGHIILADYAMTGDGLLAAMHVLQLLKNSKENASKALRCFEPFGQLKENITYDVSAGNPLEKPEVTTLAANTEDKIMAKQGRMLIRESGTEPKIRILIEAKNVEDVEQIFDSFVKEFRSLCR